MRKDRKKKHPDARENSNRDITADINEWAGGRQGGSSEIRVITKQINVRVFQQMFARGRRGKRNGENHRGGHL